MTSGPLMTPIDNRPPPSNFRQVLILARHELLRYIRGRRLIGILITVVILTAVLFVFILPGSYGGPFSGSVTDEQLHVSPLDAEAYDGYSSRAYLSGGAYGSHITNGSLVLTLNGTELPETEWRLLEDGHTVLFRTNFTSYYYLIEASFEYTADSFNVADGFMPYLSIVIVLSVLFFGADTIVGELQSRTAYLLFPSPLRREVIYLGKLLGGYLASLVVLGIFYGIIALLSYISVGSVAEYLGLSFCLACIYLLACLSFALLISSISRGVTSALISTLFLLLLAFPAVQSALTSFGAKPWFVLSFAGDAAIYSLQYGNYPCDVNEAGSTAQFFPDLGVSVAILLAYSIGLTLLGIYVFRKRETTS